MTRTPFCFTLLVIVATLASSAAADSLGCQKDIECKGVRICHEGKCVYPQDVQAPAAAQPVPALQPVPAPAAQPADQPVLLPATGYAPQSPPSIYTQPVPASQPAPGTTLFAMHRRGLEVEPRLGTAICVDSGNADCIRGGDTGLFPNVGFGLFLGVRPVTFISFGLDMGFYFYTFLIEGDTVDNSLHALGNVMFEVRPRLPFQLVDLYAKLGVGYAVFKSMYTNDDEHEKVISPYGFKVGGGANFYFVRARRYGDLGIGVDLDFIIFTPTKWAECAGTDCADRDWPDNQDFFNSFQFSFHFTWTIPIFGRAK